MNKKTGKTLLKLFPLFIFFFSLVIRLWQIDNASIYGDEVTWMVRGKELLYSLIHGNFDYLKNAWWTYKTDTEAIGIPLALINGISHITLAGAGKFSLRIFSDIVASRLPVIILGSLTPVVIYFFGLNFVNLPVALISSFLYAVNPIVISLDRWVLQDSLITLFSFLSIYFFLISVKKEKISILPGIFLSLAFLTKPNGLVVLSSWLVILLLNLKSIKVKKLFIFNLVSFLVTLAVFWPQVWFKPFAAIPEYVVRQFTLIQEGIPNFFLGEQTLNPGFFYYPFQLMIRLPEIIILGVIASLFLMVKNLKKKKLNFVFYLSIVVYFVLFLLVITISPKKLGIRYALPLFPFITIFASWGIWKLFKLLKSKILKIVFVVVFASLSLYPLSFNPNYYLFYNLFIGGPKGASNYDLVGLCFSSQRALTYLTSISTKGKVFIAGCPGSAPYYSNLEVTNDFKKADYIIIESYFEKQYPNHPIFSFMKNLKLEKEFFEKDTSMAKLYLVPK